MPNDNDPIYLVNGSQFPVSIDREQILSDSWNTDLASATRRIVADERRRGFVVSEADARAEVAARFGRGETDLMPQYHRVAQRLRK